MTEPEVTFVSHTSRPGGGELALRRYLDATSLPVRLVTMEPDGVWEGLNCAVVYARNLPALRAALPKHGVVVANSMRGAFLTTLVARRGTCFVYWVRDGLVDSAMSSVALALTRGVTARRVDYYLANSDWTAGTIRRALRVDDGEIRVVNSMCGVRVNDVRRTPRASSDSPLRLLFLGRISPWKAPHVAVLALPRLRALGVAATLTIAGGSHFGEEKYAARFMALVGNEPAATFLGHVEDVCGLLANHDVLVHCSTVPEPFGQVVIQGLGAGMPVIASAHGGPVDILGSAPVPLLYTPGDSAKLAQAISRVAADYSEASAWAVGRAVEFVDEAAGRRTDESLLRLLDWCERGGRD